MIELFVACFIEYQTGNGVNTAYIESQVFDRALKGNDHVLLIDTGKLFERLGVKEYNNATSFWVDDDMCVYIKEKNE